MAAAFCFLCQSALAAPTDTGAGTAITNQATINYQVGGISQTPVLSDNDNNPANGVNPTTFVVDQKVRVVVTAGANATVTPGAVGYLTFSVLNDGNSAAPGLAIRLAPQAGANGTEDQFDMTGVAVYYDDNGNGTYDGTEPGGANYVLTLPRDTAATIFVVATTPLSTADSQTALYHLIATAWNTGAGAPLVEDSDGDDPALSEVVFADAAGTVPAPAGPDVAFDGRHSASRLFTAAAATLSVQKNSSVISDPFGSTYRVPGARVRYSVGLANSSAATAANTVVLTDAIPTNTHFVVGSVAGGTLSEYSNDNGATWTYVPSGSPTDPAVTNLRVTVGNIAAGGNAQVTFDVMIQ